MAPFTTRYRTSSVGIVAASLIAVAALAALATPAASAQDPLPTEFTVTGHDEGGEYWFEVEGLEGRNPEIVLEPDTEYSVTFQNVGQQIHNLHFGGGIDEATELLQGGQEETITFTTPSEIGEDAFYWCDPHRQLGMEGPLSFAGGDGTGGNATDGNETDGNETNGEEAGGETPGFGVFALLAAMGAALFLVGRRKA